MGFSGYQNVNSTEYRKRATDPENPVFSGFSLLGQGPVEQSSTNKPLAMRVVGNALAYRKNLQCYNNAGSPTALQAEEVSIWI